IRRRQKAECGKQRVNPASRIGVFHFSAKELSPHWALAILLAPLLVTLWFIDLYLVYLAKTALVIIWECKLNFIKKRKDLRQQGDPPFQLLWLIVAVFEERVQASLFVPISI